MRDIFTQKQSKGHHFRGSMKSLVHACIAGKWHLMDLNPSGPAPKTRVADFAHTLGHGCSGHWRGWGTSAREGVGAANPGGQEGASPQRLALGRGKEPHGQILLGQPVGAGRDIEKHLRGWWGELILVQTPVTVCPGLSALPGPPAEWVSPSPWVGLSHQIWVLLNKNHCED